MQKRFPECTINLDRSILIRVCNVNLYASLPSLQKVAADLGRKITEKKNLLILENASKGTPSKSNMRNISSAEQSELEAIFDVFLIPLPLSDIGLELHKHGDQMICNWAEESIHNFEHKYLNKFNSDQEKAEIVFDKRNLCFEIFGALWFRLHAKSFIESLVKEMKNNHFKGNFTFKSFNSLQIVMAQLESVRASHNSVSISLDMSFDAGVFDAKKASQKPLSVMNIISLDIDSRNKAMEEIRKIVKSAEAAPAIQETSLDLALNGDNEDTFRCNHCFRILLTVNPPKKHNQFIRPEICGCYFCTPCFKEMINLQLNRRYDKHEDRMRVRCLNCIGDEETFILPFDCQKVGVELENLFNKATYAIYEHKRAYAADMWINVCKNCKTPVRIPKISKDYGTSNLSAVQKCIYRCRTSWCRLVHC